MADQLSYPMRAYAYYMDKGLPPHQAAALASNSAHEGPESTRQQGDNGTALGRFQWRGERQTGLMNYAKENKVDPYADETQWDYALHEMKNGEKDAGDKFLASKNVNEANDAMLQFLRPAGYDPKTGDVSAVPSRSSRLQMASAISNLSPLPDSQAVGTPAAPAMQVADAATATTSAIPGLLTSVLTEKKKQDQQAQTQGLLAAGQPAYTPSPPLQLPGLLALRQLNPNAAMSLPKIGQRGLLG